MRDQGVIGRDGFILYKSFWEPISQLTNEQLGRLFRAIYLWQIGEDPNPEPDIRMAFGFFANQFRIDNEKYQERCDKNRENIQKRWRQRNNTNEYDCIGPNTNRSDNDNDNDNDNKKRKTSLTLPFSDKEFIDTWNELRKQPKWKSKTVTALQKSLDKLARYDVRFAIELMNTSIENGYQGVVYPTTPSRYEQWQKSHPHSVAMADNDKEMARNVYSAYDYD
jgi:hypothetical protein